MSVGIFPRTSKSKGVCIWAREIFSSHFGALGRPCRVAGWMVTYVLLVLNFQILSFFTQKHIVFPLGHLGHTQELSFDYREKVKLKGQLSGTQEECLQESGRVIWYYRPSSLVCMPRPVWPMGFISYN